MKCPKCSFEIGEAGAASCPKCGVVFAKVQKALADEAAYKRRIASERSISAALEKQMEEDEEVRSRLGLDPDMEMMKDEEAYPVIRFLSGLFILLAVIAAVAGILGLFDFYRWAKMSLGPRELVLSMLLLAAAVVGSVVVLLAVAEGLKMGRDVANNTRAMREYLRRMAGR